MALYVLVLFVVALIVALVEYVSSFRSNIEQMRLEQNEQLCNTSETIININFYIDNINVSLF